MIAYYLYIKVFSFALKIVGRCYQRGFVFLLKPSCVHRSKKIAGPWETEACGSATTLVADDSIILCTGHLPPQTAY